MSGVYLAYDFPVLGAFWAIMWFFLWVMWFVLLFRVVVDVFRDDDLSGWAKTGWLVFTIVLPFLGVFVYVIARGKNMGRREQRHVRAQQEQTDRYIRETARSAAPSEADELAQLSQIRARGDISSSTFTTQGERVVAGQRLVLGLDFSEPYLSLRTNLNDPERTAETRQLEARTTAPGITSYGKPRPDCRARNRTGCCRPFALGFGGGRTAVRCVAVLSGGGPGAGSAALSSMSRKRCRREGPSPQLRDHGPAAHRRTRVPRPARRGAGRAGAGGLRVRAA